MLKAVKKLWEYVRQVSGDDAYERYLQHHAEAHPGEPALSCKDFYQRELDRKWSGVKRCC